LVDRINQQRICHIITIEDPIEFLHNHKRATIHQRELHSDTPSLAVALRAALRQAPNVIMVGELRDRETLEMVLEAAETGHLVLTTLNTVDAAQTVERLVAMFASSHLSSVRDRLAKTLRCVVSQRLIPRRDGRGRVAVVEILKVNPHTVDCSNANAFSRASLLEVMKLGAAEGMQHFDGEIEKLVRAGVVDPDTAMMYATDPQQLRRHLSSSASSR